MNGRAMMRGVFNMFFFSYDMISNDKSDPEASL